MFGDIHLILSVLIFSVHFPSKFMFCKLALLTVHDTFVATNKVVQAYADASVSSFENFYPIKQKTKLHFSGLIVKHKACCFISCLRKIYSRHRILTFHVYTICDLPWFTTKVPRSIQNENCSCGNITNLNKCDFNDKFLDWMNGDMVLVFVTCCSNRSCFVFLKKWNIEIVRTY